MLVGRGDRARACGPRTPTRCGSHSEPRRSNCLPGATPWICPCLLDPRRTNTGRRAYSGKDYPYRQRRHHLVFTVDRNGNTINEWLQHDAYLRPDRGAGLGELARGPHKLLINPSESPKAHLDRRRRHARDQHLHQRREAGEDDGRARRAGTRTEQFQPPDRHHMAPPTGPSLWPTDMPAHVWRSSTRTGSS